MTPLTFRPFANGSQFSDWESCNCERCTKSGDAGEAGSSACEIFEALHDAYWDSGQVSEDIARRMAYLGNEDRYVWACDEVEWAPPYLDGWARERGYADIEAWRAAQPAGAEF